MLDPKMVEQQDKILNNLNKVGQIRLQSLQKIKIQDHFQQSKKDQFQIDNRC